jgi:hypothetical protein
MRQVVFLCHVLPAWCAASSQAQKQQDQLIMDNISKTKSQNKPFLFISLLVPGICYSDRKLAQAF